MRSRDGIDAFARFQSQTCLSRYLPTHRAGAEVEQDLIRVRNLLAGDGTRVVRLRVAPGVGIEDRDRLDEPVHPGIDPPTIAVFAEPGTGR